MPPPQALPIGRPAQAAAPQCALLFQPPQTFSARDFPGDDKIKASAILTITTLRFMILPSVFYSAGSRIQRTVSDVERQGAEVAAVAAVAARPPSLSAHGSALRASARGLPSSYLGAPQANENPGAGRFDRVSSAALAQEPLHLKNLIHSRSKTTSESVEHAAPELTENSDPHMWMMQSAVNSQRCDGAASLQGALWPC